MSTNDVPGYRAENRDELALGAWGEHDDGSLVLVESTEGGRVIYSIFDMSREPVVEFRDAMAEGAFKRQFSWSPRDGTMKDKWTWRDKTNFPWDRIIKAGSRDGARIADVEEHLSEAERIRRRRQRFRGVEEDNAAQRARRARDLNEGHEVDLREIEARIERTMGKAGQAIVDKIQRALGALKPGKGKRS